MTILIDPPHGPMKMWRHMVSDLPGEAGLEELHAMADRIGLKRSWFQNHPKFPHYDILYIPYVKAVEYGAVEVSRRGLMKRLRKRGNTMNGDVTTQRDIASDFLSAMRERLQAGREKYIPAWETHWKDVDFPYDPEGPHGYLMMCLLKQFCDLQNALKDDDKALIRDQAADTANFAMFVADYHKALDDGEPCTSVK